MKTFTIAIIAAGALAIAGCDPYGERGLTKTTGGTLIGAGLGGLAGAQLGKGKGKLATTAIGALAGAFIGHEVGRSLDRADRLAMQRTTQQTLETAPSGQPSEWRNPDSGHSGTVTPTKTYQTAEGQYCREYQQTVNIGGKVERAYGRACRQPDGTWRIVQ